MDWQGKSIRIGTAGLAFAVLLRLSSAGAFTPVMDFLTSRSVAAVLLFMETGHVLREPQLTIQEETEAVHPTIDAPITEQIQPTQSVTVFAPDDAQLVEVNSVCGYAADVQTWLSHPLSWELKQEEPTVLILHSHATESYQNTEGYQASSSYRTQDTNYNMVSIGEAVKLFLESKGIRVIHDTALHDYPSYSNSYSNARAVAEQYLKEYPSIKLMLDLHRDAVTDSSGKQIKYTVNTSGGEAARLMLVVGTDAGGLSHAKWPENMSLAVKVHAQLEKICPGICRPISFRTQRFNQDLSTGALLVEVGAAGNTRQEALLAAEYLGQAIFDLANGTG